MSRYGGTVLCTGNKSICIKIQNNGQADSNEIIANYGNVELKYTLTDTNHRQRNGDLNPKWTNIVLEVKFT